MEGRVFVTVYENTKDRLNYLDSFTSDALRVMDVLEREFSTNYSKKATRLVIHIDEDRQYPRR